MNSSRDHSISAFTAVPHVPGFELIRLIGEGGFGQVWLAMNRTTGQPRAVKIIPLARVGNRDSAGREIASLMRLEAISRCRHPNLLTIQHVGQTTENLFYVMDLADDLSGHADLTHPEYRPATLKNRLSEGALPAVECERYARELLAALTSLHEAGLVHRDVKPANCLLLGGELKLADFGLLTSAELTVSQVGTLGYMPPDGCMNARADVYAAGLVIYEMLTGLPTEQFPSLGAGMHEIVEDRLSARLNRLVLRACDPNPTRRFRDAREMLAELSADGIRPVRSRWVGWLALVASVLTVAALAFSWMHRVTPIKMNFITQPYEAVIYVDGELLRGPDGVPYRTPCTVEGLTAGTHHVVFQWDAGKNPFNTEGTDGKSDVGLVDFATSRQVTAQRKSD